MFNFVSIQGNLTRDAEVKQVNTTSTRNNVISFSIAVNEFNDDVSFFDVEFWATEKQVTYFFPLLNKGVKIAVHGRLKQSRWQNKDGENRSKVLIVASDIFPHEKSGEQSQGAQAQAQAAPVVSGDLYAEDIPF